MQNMRSIEIDFDVHKLIEAERRGFDESENIALRRLLNLTSKGIEPSFAEKKPNQAVGRSWSGKGVELPHGTELRMSYNGQKFFGSIEEGVWLVDGKKSSSPSDAAGSAATTKDGARPSLNGWVYWEVKRPSDARWRAIRSLKSR
jgi:hypothetical protein